MASNAQVYGRSSVQTAPPPMDLISYKLAMLHRRAQIELLDSILATLGDDPRISVSTAGIGEDIVKVDLDIRRKLEHISEKINKAGAADSEAIDSGIKTPQLQASSETSSVDKAVQDAGQPHIQAWEPPSPAKSSHTERTEAFGRKEADVGVEAWLNGPTLPSEENSGVPSVEPGPGIAGSYGNLLTLFPTAILSCLDARTLVILWNRGILGPIPVSGEAYPALLTLDQLDSEVLSTKLEPKEALSLLYDLQSRLGKHNASDTKMELKQCHLCETFKMWLREPTRQLEHLHEFPLWKTKIRCAHKVCTDCTVKSMLRAFDYALWAAAPGVKFQCAVPGCGKYIGQIPKGGGTASYSVVLPRKDRLFMDTW